MSEYRPSVPAVVEGRHRRGDGLGEPSTAADMEGPRSEKTGAMVGVWCISRGRERSAVPLDPAEHVRLVQAIGEVDAAAVGVEAERGHRDDPVRGLGMEDRAA